MLALLATFARAYRFPSATAGVVALLAAMIVTSGQSVGLGGAPVRSLWFLMLGVAIFASLPLSDSFGTLEATFVRTGVNRTLRGAWHLCVVGAAGGLSVALSPDLALTTWFVVLSAVAFTWSAIRAEASALPLLSLGGGTILVDHTMPNYPISQSLQNLGLGPAVLAYLMCFGFYVAVPQLWPVRRRRFSTPTPGLPEASDSPRAKGR